jgi:hypothetical protein
VSIWLEDRIKDAVLALRWRRDGAGLHPDYFIDAAPDSLQFGTLTASFLAHFIADRVAFENGANCEPVEEELDQYSLEVIASYLEDRGYVVTSTGNRNAP